MANINGTKGNDNLVGTKQADLIKGLEGDDFISGQRGNDTLYGGKGNDNLYGDKDNDILYGRLGNDYLSGGDGNDYLNGFDGGSSEMDTLSGGVGADKFALGDPSKAFYANSSGYAEISDFNYLEGDKFYVFGSSSDYEVTKNGDNTADILYQGELIGFVSNTSDVVISEDFVFL